jgi:hypothetical protein
VAWQRSGIGKRHPLSSLAVRSSVIDAADLSLASTEGRSETHVSDLLELDFHSAISSESLGISIGGQHDIRRPSGGVFNLCKRIKENGINLRDSVLMNILVGQ